MTTPGIQPTQPQLNSTETEGSPFYINGGSYLAVLSGYNSGTCYLDIESPDGVWIPTDISFTANGAKTFIATQLLRYRLRIDGGSAGAQVWVMPAYSLGNF